MSFARKIWVIGEKVRSVDLNGNFEGHKISELAGEAIAGATLPVPVVLLNDVYQREYREDFNFGDVTANTRRAVQIIPRTGLTSTTIKQILRKVGSPTGNLTIEIQGDSAGSPDGTPITNGTSNTLAMSGLTTDYVEKTFTFSSAFTLVADTTYWIVLKRSDAVNGSNYAQVLGISNDFASFVGKRWNASAWSSDKLMYVEIVAATVSSLTVWKSDANVIGLHWYDGFAITTAASAGDDIDVQTNGVVSGFSSLQLNKKYYVQDTVGTIGLTVGTFEMGVGEAISDTELLIRHYEHEYIGTVSSACGETIEFSDARRAIVEASDTNSAPHSLSITIPIERVGNTTASHSTPDSTSPQLSVSATWADFTMTIGAGSSCGGGNIFYYR